MPIEWDVDGVQSAEPAIVFNMLSAQQGGRTMWTHRPFSNLTAPFTIRGQELQHDEKDWAPFFHADAAPHRRPGSHLRFVYSLQPLQILRCQLLHGYCDWVYYQQDLPDRLAQPSSHRGTIRGGTNFVPVYQSDPDMRLWAGFTLTHLDGACGSTDRPELVVSPEGEPWGLRWSAAGAEVVECSVMAAVNPSADVPVEG